MNNRTEIAITDPRPPLPADQQRVLAALRAEGARLRTRRRQRRTMAGAGAAAFALVLGLGLVVAVPRAASVGPVLPGGAAAPGVAAGADVGAEAGASSRPGATDKADATVVTDSEAVRGSGGGAGTGSAIAGVKVTSAYDAVWKVAHNQPGEFRTITTDELLSRMNVNGRSFGVVEMAGSMMIVSNQRQTGRMH